MTEKQHESYKKHSEFDMEYVIQVDYKFVDRIDDIVKSLELANYKVIPDKKNRR